MTRFLDNGTRPVLTLQSRIGWRVRYSEIIFYNPPCLKLQAVPNFPGGNNELMERGIVWDVFSLIDSIKYPGAHQVLTCTCTYAPHADLEESILVSHPDTGIVVWELDIPGLRPALDKTLIDANEGFVRLVFAREQYEADIRELVRTLQQAGCGPVTVTALDSRTEGLEYLFINYPACDSLPVDKLEPNAQEGLELECLLELDADEPWPRTPLWPAGTLIEFGFFPSGNGHALMRVNGESFKYPLPSYYFTRWDVLAAYNTWLSYIQCAFELKSKAVLHADIGRNEFVLLQASGRQRCHEAGGRFAAIFQASLQEGETAPGVTVLYRENPLHAADDGQFPAGDDAGN